MMQPPILITGCARSGTSMTAGIIQNCGAFGGKTSGPNRYNPKGMFENSRIREELVKTYLRSINCDPKGQNPLPDYTTLTTPMGWKTFVENVMMEDGYKGGPWYYKGAKMCLIWSIWHQCFPDAKWVIVRRPRKEIIHSCLNTGFMNAFDTEEGWGRWVDHHLECFTAMRLAGLDIVEFWPGDVINGSMVAAQDLINSLGLKWHSTRVQKFVDVRLWHHGKRFT